MKKTEAIRQLELNEFFSAVSGVIKGVREANEFEKKVITASLYADNGDPIKDVLDEHEVVEAICRLAKIYTAMFGLPENLDD